MHMLSSTSAVTPLAGRRFSAFLFDMDGTLITSIESANRAWTTWSRMRNFDPAHVISIMHGVRTVETMKRLGVSDPEAEAAWITKLEIEDTDGVAPIAGVAKFLAGIPEGRWAIVTSASRKLAEARLARAGIAIPPVLVTSEDVERGKPDPACFLLGAKRLNVDPAECLVFEDTVAGLNAADAAGAAALAITATHSHPIGTAHSAIPDYRGLAVSANTQGVAVVSAA
ncbi:HAD-IA family hydrolase [Sphingomonas sp. PL-96]|uniref:HAD-IA family hydrolase n=1 Tax=Sphingomonas sp. PL-96 TaxID=2887201 RepID=UPI001E2A4FB8|nr:HAD-IA family hydrolase [Sphingomonas sp. PL-96]MCC2977913.1 HAD-IA family hydrolase [Sphingomonas sp. PL-96]